MPQEPERQYYTVKEAAIILGVHPETIRRMCKTNQRLSKLEDGQAHLTTAVEAAKAGQDDIRDTMATQAGVIDVGAKVDKITRNHERRIEELEKKADLHNPYKN